jgi:hypothetical protein
MKGSWVITILTCCCLQLNYQAGNSSVLVQGRAMISSMDYQPHEKGLWMRRTPHVMRGERTCRRCERVDLWLSEVLRRVWLITLYAFM